MKTMADFNVTEQTPVVEVTRAPTKAEVKAAVQADPSLSEGTKRSLATILTLALFAIILAILFSFAYVITVAPDSFGDISQALSTPLIIALTSLGAVASLIGMKSSNSGDGK